MGLGYFGVGIPGVFCFGWFWADCGVCRLEMRCVCGYSGLGWFCEAVCLMVWVWGMVCFWIRDLLVLGVCLSLVCDWWCVLAL